MSESKWREAVARALNECDPLALDNTRAEWALRSIAEDLLASPVLAQMKREWQAEALREFGFWLEKNVASPAAHREAYDRAEASGQEGEL